jgi:DNA polymerase
MHTLQRPRIICDFETFSEVDVRDCGAWRYAEDDSTEILCLSYGMPGERKKLWLPGQPFPQEIIDHVNAGHPIEAHNCQFERAIWFWQLSVKLGIPNPQRWIDTLASCAYRGLPLGLDDVGEVLDLPIKKGKEGKSLIQKLCKPRKPTKKDPSTRNRDPELLQKLYDYCLQDGEAEDKLGETIGDLSEDEFSTWVMDQRINRRGVYVDMEAVLAAIYIVNTITENLESELASLTDGAVTGGSEVAKIGAWCASQGVKLPNLQAGTVEDFIKGLYVPLPDNVKRVLEIRQQLSRASAKKLIKFRDCTCANGRIHGLLQYHGAGTGRWAGRLVQPQNFPRGSVKDIDLLIKTILLRDADILALHYGDPMEAIASALRGMFVATPGKHFYVADFAAIEARVVMWLAGQLDALEAFAKFDRGEGPDIYCVTASKIYKRPIDKKKDPDERQLGKITVLGCGYQMSGPKLQMQASDSYGVEISLEMANLMVSTFRGDYAEVPKLWKALENAAITAIRFKRRQAVVSPNGVTIYFDFVKDAAGRWLTMELPNGRKLWYFEPGLEEREVQYTDKETGELKSFWKDSIYYQGRNNKKGGSWGRVYTYGGMLTENAVQAIARDLMVASMRRVEKAGFEIVMSVHDEVVAENEPGLDVHAFEKLVAGPNPAWARGCPVAAEAWSGRRYRK